MSQFSFLALAYVPQQLGQMKIETLQTNPLVDLLNEIGMISGTSESGE